MNTVLRVFGLAVVCSGFGCYPCEFRAVLFNKSVPRAGEIILAREKGGPAPTEATAREFYTYGTTQKTNGISVRHLAASAPRTLPVLWRGVTEDEEKWTGRNFDAIGEVSGEVALGWTFLGRGWLEDALRRGAKALDGDAIVDARPGPIVPVLYLYPAYIYKGTVISWKNPE